MASSFLHKIIKSCYIQFQNLAQLSLGNFKFWALEKFGRLDKIFSSDIRNIMELNRNWSNIHAWETPIQSNCWRPSRKIRLSQFIFCIVCQYFLSSSKKIYFY
jgi:hypothetical protein